MRSVFIALPVLVALLLGGCAADRISDPANDSSTLEGTWVAAGPEGDKAVLDLRADGTMSFSGMPTQIVLGNFGPKLGDPIDWTETTDRAGTWSVESNGEYRYLSFLYSPNVGDHSSMLLSLERDQGAWDLYYSAEEFGSRVLFDLAQPATGSATGDAMEWSSVLACHCGQ